MPGQPELVALTATDWARGVGSGVFFAFADTARYAVEEHPDGSVRHAPIDPDTVDDAWRDTEAVLRAQLTDAMRESVA